jgi:hypothetical protein
VVVLCDADRGPVEALTVMVDVQVWVSPQSLVAVQVMLWVPTSNMAPLNVLPAAGETPPAAE